MRRLTVTQLLFAIALAAILCSLFTAEGCGFRYATVSAIAIAPDSRSMAVVRHDARQGLGKAFYLNDIRRTISVMQLPSLQQPRVVVRDPKPGVTASDIVLYGPGQKDFIAFGPSAHTLVLTEFATNKTRVLDLTTLKSHYLAEDTPIDMFRSSSDGKRLIIGQTRRASVWDLSTSQQLSSRATSSTVFQRSPHVAISPDGSTAAAIGFDLVVWDDSEVDYSTQVGNREVSGVAISSSNDCVAVALSDYLEIIHTNPTQVQLPQSRTMQLPFAAQFVQFTANGEQLVVAGQDQMTVIEIPSLKHLDDISLEEPLECMSLSPDGKWLVTGHKGGEVHLWDANSFQRVAREQAPGQMRHSRLVPIVSLAIWLLVVSVAARRKMKRETNAVA